MKFWNHQKQQHHREPPKSKVAMSQALLAEAWFSIYSAHIEMNWKWLCARKQGYLSWRNKFWNKVKLTVSVDAPLMPSNWLMEPLSSLLVGAVSGVFFLSAIIAINIQFQIKCLNSERKNNGSGVSNISNIQELGMHVRGY